MLVNMLMVMNRIGGMACLLMAGSFMASDGVDVHAIVMAALGAFGVAYGGGWWRESD